MQDVLTLEILVVDDDPVIIEFCRKVLEGAGHRVWAAAEARKALELLARQEVDLVLSDLKMPGMNGGEFLKKVKALHAQTQFVVMTGFGTVTSAATLMKNGAGDYLEKPFTAQALLRVVAGMLRQIRREREGHSLEELAGLWEISRALDQGAEPESVLAKIADLSTVLTHAGRALIFLYDASTSRLKLKVNVPSGELPDGLSVDEMRELAEQVLWSGEPVALSPGLAPSGVRQVPAPVLLVPMRLENRLIGVICLEKAPRRQPFSLRDLKVMAVYADGAAHLVLTDHLMAVDRRRLELLVMLNRLSLSLAGADDVVQTIELVLPVLDELFEVPVAGIAAVTASGVQLHASSERKLDRRYVAAMVHHVQSTVSRFQRGSPIEVGFDGRYMQAPRFDGTRPGFSDLEQTPVVSQLLMQRDRMLGVIVLGTWPERPIDEVALSALENLAHHLTAALTAAERAEQIRQCHTQMMQAAKMAALGELSSTIVHEINNPLTNITGFAQLLLSQTPPDSPCRIDLTRLLSNADRIGNIVHTLLRFARKRELTTGMHKLSDICEGVLELVQPEIRNGSVTVKRLFAPGEPEVTCDRSQLEQVVLNLVMNAVHAMPGGGTLTLRTIVGEQGADLEVADTGTGIAPEVLPRIFEPFFTTKKEGHGTGLGLSFSRNIVEMHQGSIEVRSTPGQGTVFTVKLPHRPVRSGRNSESPIRVPSVRDQDNGEANDD